MKLCILIATYQSRRLHIPEDYNHHNWSLGTSHLALDLCSCVCVLCRNACVPSSNTSDVCVCVYVCMYMYVCIHVYMYYVCMYTRIYVSFMYVYMCICIYICTYVYVCIYTCIYVCVCMYGYMYVQNGQNNGNTKKVRNRICVGYIGRTSVGNTECSSSVCLHSVVLVSVH